MVDISPQMCASLLSQSLCNSIIKLVFERHRSKKIKVNDANAQCLSACVDELSKARYMMRFLEGGSAAHTTSEDVTKALAQDCFRASWQLEKLSVQVTSVLGQEKSKLVVDVSQLIRGHQDAVRVLLRAWLRSYKSQSLSKMEALYREIAINLTACYAKAEVLVERCQASFG